MFGLTKASFLFVPRQAKFRFIILYFLTMDVDISRYLSSCGSMVDREAISEHVFQHTRGRFLIPATTLLAFFHFSPHCP
jgi:hypothetical protein